MKVLLLLEKCGDKRQKMIDISAYFLDILDFDGHCLSYVEHQIVRKSEQASVRVSVIALCAAVRAMMDISKLLIVRCGNGPHTQHQHHQL